MQAVVVTVNTLGSTATDWSNIPSPGADQLLFRFREWAAYVPDWTNVSRRFDDLTYAQFLQFHGTSSRQNDKEGQKLCGLALSQAVRERIQCSGLAPMTPTNRHSLPAYTRLHVFARFYINEPASLFRHTSKTLH